MQSKFNTIFNTIIVLMDKESFLHDGRECLWDAALRGIGVPLTDVGVLRLLALMDLSATISNIINFVETEMKKREAIG